MNEKKPLIVIAGPTASGKTSTAVALAKAIDGEIISADSMQVYRGMDIGTAKVTAEEMAGVPHHLIDVLEPDQGCSIAAWQQMVKAAMEDIYARGKVPILAGGTGFYIQSIIYDIDFEENEDDKTYRHRLEEIAGAEGGKEKLFELLKSVDPVSAETIHMNNVKRVIRAIEYHQITGEPISEHNEREKQKETPYNLAFFVLTMEREVLYERINMRVDMMVDDGLIQEVKGLLDAGYSPELVSMQGIGYKEIVPYLRADSSLDEALHVLKRDTRHFAKRQFTWFKREPAVEWVDVTDYPGDVDKIVPILLKYIEEYKIL